MWTVGGPFGHQQTRSSSKKTHVLHVVFYRLFLTAWPRWLPRRCWPGPARTPFPPRLACRPHKMAAGGSCAAPSPGQPEVTVAPGSASGAPRVVLRAHGLCGLRGGLIRVPMNERGEKKKKKQQTSRVFHSSRVLSRGLTAGHGDASQEVGLCGSRPHHQLPWLLPPR